MIEGLERVVARDIDVANMSYGSPVANQSLHDAIVAAHNAGVTLVAAAGNEGGPVVFPAAYPEVIAVAATDRSDARPWWSNLGPEVDLAAPGVSILSSYKGSSYATLSGPSMATPHVADAASLVISLPIPPAYDANADGQWNPAEVQQLLQDTATDAGGPDRDSHYGWGIVNAYAALP